MHGHGMGTHGRGSRKKAKKSGHHGGVGMAGTGKRADHKKSLILKLYGHGYFGKQGITSRGTKRDKRKKMSIGAIEENIETLLKKGIAKKSKDGFEINLDEYKILGVSEDYKLKNKFFIKAKGASKSAIEKIKEAGGEIQLK